MTGYIVEYKGSKNETNYVETFVIEYDIKNENLVTDKQIFLTSEINEAMIMASKTYWKNFMNAVKGEPEYEIVEVKRHTTKKR